MDDRRLVEYHRRESPASEPRIVWEVVFPPIAAAIAMYMVAALRYDGITARAFAGAVMLIVLGWRLWRFDRNGRGVHIVEHEQYVVDDREPQRVWAPVIQDNGDDGNGGHRWRIGSWYFSQAEWTRLWSALESGNVTRDGLAAVTLDNGNRMFPNTTARYSEYLRKLQNMGWVDGDNRVTPAARAWFAERDIAPPPG